MAKEKKDDPFGGEPKEGEQAPDFRQVPASGASTPTVSLGDYAGKTVVLYFYPKDDTPGCTTEACDFRDNMALLSQRGIVVLGVSKDSPASHDKFRTKYQLPFPLLSDGEGSLCQAYGVFKEKMMYGVKRMGIERSTFVIGPDGKILRALRGIKATGHVAALLSDPALSGTA
ncbi:MAG: peroxiredoxin [Leptospirillia bacterium]